MNYKSLVYISSLVGLTWLAGCRIKKDEAFFLLGDQGQEKVWIYLCGLTQDFNDKQELSNRSLLDRVGCATNAKFIAIKPVHRCVEFENKLCWPHSSKVARQKIYQEILEIVGPRPIAGFVGFSNGGFFLNRLVQERKLGVPIVSIGSAGFVESALHKNEIYLIIGKNDLHHHGHAVNMAAQAKMYPNLTVTLIEHEGAHEIPEEGLRKLLQALLK